jgi:hypothetical protein
MKLELNQERMSKLEADHKSRLQSNEITLKELYELKQNFERMQA